MGLGTLRIAEDFRPFFGAGLSTVLDPARANDWPAPWDVYWSKAKPAPLVFTYAELGEDLGENPSPDRRRLLGALIGKLAWPKGTITFWPTRTPGANPDPTLFLRGVRRLGGRAVCCFGSSSIEGLGLPEASVSFEWRGIQMLVAPELSDDYLLGDPAAELSACLQGIF